MEINVKEIMNKIRRDIEERKAKIDSDDVKKIEYEELKPWADHSEIKNFYEPILYGNLNVPSSEPPQQETLPVKGQKGLKNILKRIFSIPRPLLMRFLLFYLRPHMDYIDSKFHEIGLNLQRSMEYIKLLHNLSNNMVVEMSKLKVEVDALRNRLITVENKLEFLEKRERILEEKVLNQDKYRV
jgi:hypothetical protein